VLAPLLNEDGDIVYEEYFLEGFENAVGFNGNKDLFVE